MRQIHSLFALLLVIIIACNKQELKKEKEDSTTISFEEFAIQFPVQSSPIQKINQENALDFSESPEIESIYFQNFLQGKFYLNQESEKIAFIKNTSDNQEITYRVAIQISLSPQFHSLIISANTEGDPTHEWAYYLLNYTKDGRYIDGILLSYRNSYTSEETTTIVSQSEYRYVSFLPKNQLHFTDVNYDNTLQANTLKEEQNATLTSTSGKDSEYFRESWYQITENGAFKSLKIIERNKNEAHP
jgi:hypothetical protein